MVDEERPKPRLQPIEVECEMCNLPLHYNGLVWQHKTTYAQSRLDDNPIQHLPVPKPREP